MVTGTPVSLAYNAAANAISTDATATCAAGKVLLGGGATVSQGTASGGPGAKNPIVSLVQSGPSSTTAWKASIIQQQQGTGTAHTDSTVTAYAFCSQ
jgi:hypothetical protein